MRDGRTDRRTGKTRPVRQMAHDPSSPPKLLVPEKSGTRTHGTRAKLLVPVSGTRNLGGELGSCAIGLTIVQPF